MVCVLLLIFLFIGTSLGAEYNNCPTLVRDVPGICEDLHYSKYCPDSCRDRQYSKDVTDSHSLTCYNCHNIHHPDACTRTTKCQSNEACVITAALDASFRVTYRQGCFFKQNCSLFVHDNISNMRRNAVLPGDCCYTSLCNHHKPEETSKQALTCYSCTETDHPKSCVTTTQCRPDQLCVVTQALNANFKMVYRLGCMDRHQCDAFRHDGLGNRRSIVAKGDCCDHDRCNSYTPEEIGSPTFNSKDCKDVDANVCQDLRHSHHVDRCQEKEFANVFCPKTCNTCFKCYNCFLTNAQNFHLCSKSNYSVCETKTQSCVIDLFNGIAMMLCVNDTMCADAIINKHCCKNDFCNTPDSLTPTTTSTTEVTTPSTVKTSPTTTEVTTPSTVKTSPTTMKVTTVEVTTPSTVKTSPTTTEVTTPSTVKTSPTTPEVTTPSTRKTSPTTGSTFGFVTIPHQQATTTAFHWATLGTPPHSTKWVTLPWSGDGQPPPSRK